MPVAAAAPRPVAAQFPVASISMVDKVLAIAAAVVALAAVASTVYIWTLELPPSSGATPEKAAASTVHLANIGYGSSEYYHIDAGNFYEGSHRVPRADAG
jgi:hypothetical protein